MNWSAMGMAVLVSLLGVAIGGTVGVYVGWKVAAKRTRTRRVHSALVMWPLVVAPMVLTYAVFSSVGRLTWFGRVWENIVGTPMTFAPEFAVVCVALMSMPICFVATRAAIERVDGRLEDAARVAGMTERSVASTITFPLAKSGVLAGVVVALGRALGDFGLTIMVAGNLPEADLYLPAALRHPVGDGSGTGATSIALMSMALASMVIAVRMDDRRGAQPEQSEQTEQRARLR